VIGPIVYRTQKWHVVIVFFSVFKCLYDILALPENLIGNNRPNWTLCSSTEFKFSYLKGKFGF